MEWWLIVVLMGFSAFFSGSETAFFSLNKLNVKKLQNSPDRSRRRIWRLLRNPRELLVAILLVNTVVNVVASSLATVFTIKLAHQWFSNPGYTQWLLAAEVILMSALLLIVGEITPKLFALSRPEGFAAFSGLFIEILYWILWPVIKILYYISSLLSKSSFDDRDANDHLTGEDFHNLVVSADSHPLAENERKIIDGIFRFSSTDAKEIMTPRVDMVTVSLNDSIESVRKVIVSSGHSRIPVCKKGKDDIAGFIYAKDIIMYQGRKSISAFLRNAVKVPENKGIQELLNIFRTRRTHIAIVVDEYGGTSGLVSLEDVLEVLVGDIADEYDKETPMLKELSPYEVEAQGMYPVVDLNERFELDISDEHDTLAGFLLDEFNKVPEPGEELLYLDRIHFKVLSVQNHRIAKVRIKVEAPAEEM